MISSNRSRATMRAAGTCAAWLVAVMALAQVPAQAQAGGQATPAAQARPDPRAAIPVDAERARQLYVPVDPALQSPGRDYQRDVDAKQRDDARYADLCRGVLRCTKITYRSRVGDLDVPAYLFQPLTAGAPRSRPALVWVHGGVHGNWSISMFPFVREAVARGYVVLAPEYRGSTGYGEAYHRAIDYGGYEVDDVLTAADYLKTLPDVDPARLGIMGWSHGGYITLLAVFRASHPFASAAAMVPVTNLVFRLSYKGPRYQWDFATQARIGGLPFEKRDVYIARSPLYHVDALAVPLLVHVATNDTDVDFVEDQQIVDALRSRKPHLAETKIYVDPPPGAAGGGHTFNRRVDVQTLERQDTPEQVDSWNRVWTFFDWTLRTP